MKPHDVELTYNYATRTVKHGGMPVAISVEDEWGPILAAAPDMARVLLEDMAAASNGIMHDGTCLAGISGAGVCNSICIRKRDALRKAGVLP